MTYIGIDPGKSGGLAALDAEGRVLMATPMPPTTPGLIDLLMRVDERAKVTLEQVHAMPRHMSGSVGNFSLGHGFGVLEGALAAFAFPVSLVAPIKWMNALDCRTRGDKNVSKRRAAELFPRIRVTHALADALLLAEYGRRLDAGNRSNPLRLVVRATRR